MDEIHEPEVFARFASVLGSLHHEESLPMRLGRAGAIVLEADGVAITVNYDSDARLTVCTSDELAATLEDLQDVLGQGPGFEAARSGEVVRWQVGDGDDRWPLLSESIERVPFVGVMLAVPLLADHGPLGVLTAHASGQGVIDERVAPFLGVTVAAALLAEPDLDDDEATSWHERSAIHQATGMVVSQVGVRPEDALALLKGQAYARAVSLGEVALDITERRINFRDFTIEGD